jgi:hypothetical protein
MERASSLTLRWVPRRSHLLVISANHRSTRFIHDDDLGVKWKSNREWRSNQRWISGVLWLEELSSSAPSEEFAAYVWDRRIDSGNRMTFAPDGKTRLGTPWERAHCSDSLRAALMDAGLLRWADYRAGLLAPFAIDDSLRDVGSRQAELI